MYHMGFHKPKPLATLGSLPFVARGGLNHVGPTFAAGARRGLQRGVYRVGQTFVGAQILRPDAFGTNSHLLMSTFANTYTLLSNAFCLPFLKNPIGRISMRRPRFQNWARSELLKAACSRSFSLRKMAALAQSRSDATFVATLMLYAHEAGCLERLLALVYDPGLLDEFRSVEHHLGQRSVERLALRGTPMMALPQVYRTVFRAYEAAYHAPELQDQEKQALQQRSKLSMLKLGLSPSEIAHDLGLNYANAHAYLVRGDTHRFTLATARAIDDHLAKLLENDA